MIVERHMTPIAKMGSMNIFPTFITVIDLLNFVAEIPDHGQIVLRISPRGG
jgi:hypothetical protein